MSRKRTARVRRGRDETPAWLKKPFQKLSNPVAPTEWCSPPQLDKIDDATMRILENVGVDFMDEEPHPI